MNCFYHPESPAVTICAVCGKGLCLSCARSSGICPSCKMAQARNAAFSAMKYLVVLFILGFIGYKWDFIGSESHHEGMLSAYILMSICTGAFVLLGQLQLPANTILVYDASSYGIYQLISFIFKACISLVLGLIITPVVIIWQVFRLIRNILLINQIKNSRLSV